MATILIVDDELPVAEALSSSLSKRQSDNRFHLRTAAIEAATFANEHRPEVVVLDLSLDSTGPSSGLHLLEQLLTIDETVRVIVLTGNCEDRWGIKAIEGGAVSFLKKPADLNHLQALIIDGINTATIKRKLAQVVPDDDRIRFGSLVSQTATMKSCFDEAAIATVSDQPVLIIGETGSGKGMLAREIHKLHRRRNGPLVLYQPTTKELTASALFGHQRGAFTGAVDSRTGVVEEAHKGTLLIDEVDELPHDVQLMLLEALQSKTFRKLGASKPQSSDFRLICTTNRGIAEIRAKRLLRDDFYHRIAHLIIELPPLRERMDDLKDLAFTALSEVSSRSKLNVSSISEQALKELAGYSWPGNVRELLAVVESAATRASFRGSRKIEPRDINLRSSKSDPTTGTFRCQVERFEVELVRTALERSNNNQSEAARILNLDRSSLRRILHRAGKENF